MKTIDEWTLFDDSKWDQIKNTIVKLTSLEIPKNDYIKETYQKLLALNLVEDKKAGIS